VMALAKLLFLLHLKTPGT